VFQQQLSQHHHRHYSSLITFLVTTIIIINIIMATTTTATAAAEKQRAYHASKASSAASSTSFYTTEEKKDKYHTLEEVLEKKCFTNPQLRQVIEDLMRVCADITDALRVALVTVENSTNDFGDSLLSVDVRRKKERRDRM
jgi:sedoheptulose-bisphosphatase